MSSGDRLSVDVLGPIQVRDADGRDVTPEGVLQRRLLALLILRRGRAVTADAAIDVLWPASRPRDPAAALQNQVFRLRRALPDGVVESTGNGYRVPPAAIDLDADRLSAALSATEDAAAAGWIDIVLDRWHGPAYPELDDMDEGRAEAGRLDELRVRAREVRAERRLAAGGADDLIVELAALADEEPLRERPRALLMTALAMVGRTAEALRVYDDFRRLLGEELGIEPSPVLAAQHATLLTATDVSSWRPASRLPVPLTSLVGREGLVADVTALVAEHRLVTLIGPGGVGKTRLLGEVGLRVRAARSERAVVMCELATATPESAVDVVATALAIDGRPGIGLTDRVAAVLADNEIVLLLDNCEHVLEPVAHLVERLLAACPAASVVATSRERLRLPGERLCTVPPLATQPSLDDGTPAVQLFVERARAVAPDFDPDEAQLAVVAEIVRRLDGLPLAIELAAARLHTLDVNEVAAGLDERFGLLSSGYRTSTRHGSLRAAMSWSFELLDPRLQRTFADLSMFAGSFTASDAAAICGLDARAVTDDLDQLVERSLVMRTSDRRYVLLETLRAFGAECLAAADRVDETGERHARHYVEWIEDAVRRMAEPEVGTALTAIDAALPELRTALGWLLDHAGPANLEQAGRMMLALLDYGFLRLRPDVLAWSHRVVDADPGDSSPLAAAVWALSGYAAWMGGDIEETGRRVSRAMRLAEQSGVDTPLEVAMMWASYELFEGHLEESARWYRVAHRAAGDRAGKRLLAAGSGLLALAYAGDPTAVEGTERLLEEVGESCNPYAAWAWYCAGEADMAVDAERARQRLTRALEVADATGASIVAGVAGASKASIEARIGDPLVAADDYRRLINHWRRAGMWATQWTMLRAIAGLLARLGRMRDAAVLTSAVRATRAGHRIFGQDEAALTQLDSELRAALGDEIYDAARREGAALDGEGAAQLALRALAPDV